MKGAREYYDLFTTGQYEKLFIQIGIHARGKTIRIWIIPNGEEFVIKDGRPFNSNAVEVYGIIGGHPGWTETYGWLHRGKWVQDFEELVYSRRQLEIDSEKEKEKSEKEQKGKKKEKIKNLLSQY